MDRWKNELGTLLRILGLVLVTGTGGWMFLLSCRIDSGWVFIPGFCGAILVLAGTAGVLLALVRNLLDPSDEQMPPAPLAPPPPPPPVSTMPITPSSPSGPEKDVSGTSNGKKTSKRKTASKRSSRRSSGV